MAKIAGILAMLLLLCSGVGIVCAADFGSMDINSGVEEIDYEQLEEMHKAQYRFGLMKDTTDYYAILEYDREIREKIEMEQLSWSDLEVQDEIEYSLIVCESRREAALAAWQSLHEEKDMSQVDKDVCVEIICSAVEEGDLDWDKDLDGIGENTLKEIVDKNFNF